MEISMTFEASGYPGMAIDVDDDNNVAYAYFLKNGEITGYVWLYNHKNWTPNPWNAPTDRNGSPTNIEGYFNDDGFRPIESQDEVEVLWDMHYGFVHAAVYVRGSLLGIVADQLMPGWSRLATRDSPVAIPLDSAPQP